MRWRGKTTCEAETADDFDCVRQAARIGEWVAEGRPVILIPLCRRHARQKARAGWRVRRVDQEELSRLADRRDSGEAP
jgi:hypothetical protein